GRAAPVAVDIDAHAAPSAVGESEMKARANAGAVPAGRRRELVDSDGGDVVGENRRSHESESVPCRPVSDGRPSAREPPPPRDESAARREGRARREGGG